MDTLNCPDASCFLGCIYAIDPGIVKLTFLRIQGNCSRFRHFIRSESTKFFVDYKKPNSNFASSVIISLVQGGSKVNCT